MPVEDLSTCLQTIGQYDLLDKIAEGGMGTVYRGRSRATGETVAVKVVPQHLLSNPVVLKRFEQEYNVARAIDHPNIVKALDFGREADTRYLVMEFVEGESLGQKIERYGKMCEDEALRIITQVALGLQKAHKMGLIHRDVKPDNVLLTADGQVKLTDLGLVKEIEADLNLTRTGRGLGTPHFMSPEQFRNAKKADVRCDIYSLGATLYMMVTGVLPFQSSGPLDAWMKKINNEIEPPRAIVPDLSERTDWAIRRAISPDPAQRPESCREFIEDLTGRATKDLSTTASGPVESENFWYMVYTDDEGGTHTVKGTLQAIRRSLQDGLLGDAENMQISQAKDGPFECVRAFPEFRDLIIQPASLRPQKDSDPGAKKPLSSIEIPRRSDPSKETAVHSTKTPTPPDEIPEPSSRPTIDLVVNRRSLSDDIWKWVVFGTIFASLGALATYFLPMLRHLRAF